MWGQEDEKDFLTSLKVAAVNAKDVKGHMNFDFLKHFLQMCEHKGKNSFVDKRSTYLKSRRDALVKGDDHQYSKLVVDMIQEEEKNMNEIIQAALKSINMDMQTFGYAMMES